jgi:hypothetical protein
VTAPHAPSAMFNVSLYKQDGSSLANWIKSFFQTTKWAELLGAKEGGIEIRMATKKRGKVRNVDSLVDYYASENDISRAAGFMATKLFVRMDVLLSVSLVVLDRPVSGRINAIVSIPLEASFLALQLLIGNCYFANFGSYLYDEFVHLKSNFSFPTYRILVIPASVAEESRQFQLFRETWGPSVAYLASHVTIMPSLESDAEVLDWYVLVLQLFAATNRFYGASEDLRVKDALQLSATILPEL